MSFKLPLAAALPQGTRRIPLADPAAADQLLVLGIETPHSTLRDAARATVRSVARQALGAILACRPESVPLVSSPGQPLRVDLPGRPIGLSVSHEAGLSLLAINLHGAVGIDLMRLDQQFDWASDWQPVAHDYLGQDAGTAIANAPAERRQKMFAGHWTALEASLKCNGLPLSEWDAMRARNLRQCRTAALELPHNMVGAVAIFKEIARV